MLNSVNEILIATKDYIEEHGLYTGGGMWDRCTYIDPDCFCLLGTIGYVHGVSPEELTEQLYKPTDPLLIETIDLLASKIDADAQNYTTKPHIVYRFNDKQNKPDEVLKLLDSIIQ